MRAEFRDRLRMHVCHLAKYYPPASGGIESHVQTLARGQRKSGLDVTVVCINHRDQNGADVLRNSFSSTDSTEEVDEGVRILRVGRRFSVSKWDYSPGLGQKLSELSQSTPPIDLFHLHSPNVTMLLALYFLRHNAPLVVTHHSDIVKQVWGEPIVRLLERRILRRAAVVLTTSPDYAEGSRQLADFLPKVETLPLGTELQRYFNPSTRALEFRDQLRARHEGPLWLSVGRLVYYKGLETALSALNRIPGTLLIIGEGPERRALEQRAEALGVTDRIEWLGHVSGDELVGAYHAATALLFPSNARSEAFGLVQVEAMASGCPVINTAIPYSGVAWVSLHELTGLTVPVGNAEALAAAAQRLIQDPGLRQSLAAAAKRRSAELFDAKQMILKSGEIYRRLMPSPHESDGTTRIPMGPTILSSSSSGLSSWRPSH